MKNQEKSKANVIIKNPKTNKILNIQILNVELAFYNKKQTDANNSAKWLINIWLKSVNSDPNSSSDQWISHRTLLNQI